MKLNHVRKYKPKPVHREMPRVLLALANLLEQTGRPVSRKEIAKAANMTEGALSYHLDPACERGQVLRTEQRGGKSRVRYLYSLPPA